MCGDSFVKDKTKGIGTTTSLTIPKQFVNYVTQEKIEVSEKHLQFINENSGRGDLISIVMTGIHLLAEHEAGDHYLPIVEQMSEMNSKITDMDQTLRQLKKLLAFSETIHNDQ
jgi:galactitol-specific phosphotransferase system IIB component